MSNDLPPTMVDPLQSAASSGDLDVSEILNSEQIALLQAAVGYDSINESGPALHQSTPFPQLPFDEIQDSPLATSQTHELQEEPAVDYQLHQRQVPAHRHQPESHLRPSGLKMHFSDDLRTISPILLQQHDKPASDHHKQQRERPRSGHRQRPSQGPTTPTPKITAPRDTLSLVNQEQQARQFPSTPGPREEASVNTTSKKAEKKRKHVDDDSKNSEQSCERLTPKKVKKNQDDQNKRSRDLSDAEDGDGEDEQPRPKKSKHTPARYAKKMPKRPQNFGEAHKQVNSGITRDKEPDSSSLITNRNTSTERGEQELGANSTDTYKPTRMTVPRKAPMNTPNETPKSSKPMPKWHPQKVASPHISVSKAHPANNSRNYIAKFNPSKELTDTLKAPEPHTLPATPRGISIANNTSKLRDLSNLPHTNIQISRPLGISPGGSLLRSSNAVQPHTLNSPQVPKPVPSTSMKRSSTGVSSRGSAGGTDHSESMVPQQRVQTQHNSQSGQTTQSRQQSQAQAQTQAGIPVDRCIVPLMNKAIEQKSLPDTWAVKEIDHLAHLMWQVAIDTPNIMNHICNAVGLWNHGKLRMLAMANILPTWWFLREQAVVVMKTKGWDVDDSFYNGEMEKYYRICKQQDNIRRGGV